jgi:hypothetical protein
MQWFTELENSNVGNRKKPMRFKNEITFENIKKVGLQMDFHFGTGSGCQSGESCLS